MTLAQTALLALILGAYVVFVVLIGAYGLWTLLAPRHGGRAAGDRER